MGRRVRPVAAAGREVGTLLTRNGLRGEYVVTVSNQVTRNGPTRGGGRPSRLRLLLAEPGSRDPVAAAHTSPPAFNDGMKGPDASGSIEETPQLGPPPPVAHVGRTLTLWADVADDLDAPAAEDAVRIGDITVAEAGTLMNEPIPPGSPEARRVAAVVATPAEKVHYPGNFDDLEVPDGSVHVRVQSPADVLFVAHVWTDFGDGLVDTGEIVSLPANLTPVTWVRRIGDPPQPVYQDLVLAAPPGFDADRLTLELRPVPEMAERGVEVLPVYAGDPIRVEDVRVFRRGHYADCPVRTKAAGGSACICW